MFLHVLYSSMLLVLSLTLPAFAADHIDAPLVRDNPKLDITDVYVFRNPLDSSRVVVALNVFTPVGLPDSERLFASIDEGEYAIFIDTDDDLAADHTIRITFSKDAGTAQEFTVRGIPGSGKLKGLVSNATGSGQSGTDGNAIAFAGLRDDPFFFDFEGFTAFLAAPCVPEAGLRCPGTGAPVNFFHGLNVAAIVLEFPVNKLSGIDSVSSGKIGVWAETFVK